MVAAGGMAVISMIEGDGNADVDDEEVEGVAITGDRDISLEVKEG